MKKIFITMVFICMGLLSVFAQSATTSFDVDGIKVIFKPTLKQIVSVRMFYRGGVSNYTQSQAGIERFALTGTIECGTKKYNATQFKDIADKYGINTNVGAEYDYGSIQMEFVSKYFNQGWDLFTEAVNNPVFDAGEVQLLKTKITSQIKQGQTNPDEYTNQMILNSAFAGTPYATNPDGDADVINKLTGDDLKSYYFDHLNKKSMFIVVAGKISKDELIEKIRASFAALPSKPYTPAALAEPVWNDYSVNTESRNLSTNYIYAIMNAPPVNSPDYVPYRIGMSAVGGTLFIELRTKLHLSYAPGAASITKLMPYGLMYVSTTDPKQAVSVMTEQLNRVLSVGLSETGLKEIKSGYLVDNYIDQQSTSAITYNLGFAEIMGGWETAEGLPDVINNVTVNQINKVMRKYIIGLKWSYLGNTDQASLAADAFKNKIH